MRPIFSFCIGEQKFVFLAQPGETPKRQPPPTGKIAPMGALPDLHVQSVEIPDRAGDRAYFANLAKAQEAGAVNIAKLEKLEDPARVLKINEQLLAGLNRDLGLNLTLKHIKDLVSFRPLEIDEQRNPGQVNRDFVEHIRAFQKMVGAKPDGKFGLDTFRAAITYAQVHGQEGKPQATILGSTIQNWLGGRRYIAVLAKKIEAPTPEKPSAPPAALPREPLLAGGERLPEHPPSPQAGEEILEGKYKQQYEKLARRLELIFNTFEREIQQTRTTDSNLTATEQLARGKERAERYGNAIAAEFKAVGIKPPPHQELTIGERAPLLAFAKSRLEIEQGYAKAKMELDEERNQDLAEKYERIYTSLRDLLQTWEKTDDPRRRQIIWDTFIGFAKTNLGLTANDLAKLPTTLDGERIARQTTLLALQKGTNRLTSDTANEAQIAYFKANR